MGLGDSPSTTVDGSDLGDLTVNDKLVDPDEIPIENEEVEYVYDSDDEAILEGMFYVLPNLKQRWKSVVLAIVLFILGITFLVMSIVYFVLGDWGYAISTLFLTFICGLPGGRTIPFYMLFVYFFIKLFIF